MRRLIYLVMAIIVAITSGCGKNSSGNNEETEILTIQDIQSDPLAFVGEIKINGVASAFSQEDSKSFSVMDTAEMLTCKNLYCGAYAMPAKYVGEGDLPELADVVDMTGSFVKTDKGYYFEVKSYLVRRNIMNLLDKSGGVQ